MTILSAFAMVLALQATAEPPREPLHPPIDYAAIEAEVARNLEALGLAEEAADRIAAFTRETATPLIFPVRSSDASDQFLVHHISNYFDLDENGPNHVLDFSCWSRSYDLATGYDHQGTDIVLGPFRWQSMDAREGEIIAAAGGIVAARQDGFNDRVCTGDFSASSNYIVILQDDGLHAYYYHIAVGTVADLEIGARVEAGDFLGHVGSSGTSTEPHLHFELRTGGLFAGVGVDPYAGPCGASVSLWRHQHAAIDGSIRALYTHSVNPNLSPDSCVEDRPNLQSLFAPGDPITFGVYMRDQNFRSRPDLEVLRPDGSTEAQYTFGETPGLYPSSFWIANHTLASDAPAGQWRMRATYRGHTRERTFYVGSAPEDGARLRSAILPSSRSVQASGTATVFATVLNPSDTLAQGCSIHPGMPFNGIFTYRATDPATNAVTGDVNAVFDIPAGEARTFVLAFETASDALSRSLDMTMRYRCDNAGNAPEAAGVNTVLLTVGPNPVPDMVGVSLTPSSDGILRLAGNSAGSAFVVATANVGEGGFLIVTPQARGAASSLRLRICETDPGTGACVSTPGESYSRTFNAGETASFAVFAAGQGSDVPFNPAENRIVFEAADSLGNVRGSTSVAVRTN